MKQMVRILSGILFFVLIGANILQAQTSLEERIHAQLSELKKDSDNLRALCNLTGLYLKQPDFPKAIYYGNRFQEKAYDRRPINRDMILQSHLLLGQAYTMTGQRRLAYNNLGQARTNAEALKDTASLSLAYLGLGLYASNLDLNYYRALSYFFEGLKLAKSIQDEEHRSILLANIALIYELKKDTLGLPYAQECYEHGHAMRDPYLIHIGANTSALLYSLQGKYDRALSFIHEDEKLVAENHFADLAFTYSIYANTLAGLNDFAHSIEYFRQALSCKEQSQPSSVLYAYVEYAKTLASLKRYDEALALLQEGEGYAEQHQVGIFRNQLTATLARIYELKGELPKAIYYLRRSQAENDSLFNISKEETIRNLQIEYQTDLLQEQVKQQQLEREHREEQLRILLIGLALILVLSIVLFMLYRHTRKLYRAIVVQNQEAFHREELLHEEIQQWKRKTADLNEELQKKVVASEENGNSCALSEEKRKALFAQLEQLLREERIYTDNQLSREKVAERLKTNRTYLTQIINEFSGKNFTQYINEYRTHEAVRRLSDPNEHTPLKALVAELGFNSMTTFYSLFQNATGMTPTQYRKQVEEL
jgi:AraC-like DNA-binding protein